MLARKQDIRAPGRSCLRAVIPRRAAEGGRRSASSHPFRLPRYLCVFYVAGRCQAPSSLPSPIRNVRSSAARRRAGRPLPAAARAGGLHYTAMREPCDRRHHAGPDASRGSMTQASSSIRARTILVRPPETVQSQSGHVSCGTFSVAVARRPYTTRTRSARVTATRAARSTRLSGSRPWGRRRS